MQNKTMQLYLSSFKILGIYTFFLLDLHHSCSNLPKVFIFFPKNVYVIIEASACYGWLTLQVHVTQSSELSVQLAPLFTRLFWPSMTHSAGKIIVLTQPVSITVKLNTAGKCGLSPLHTGQHESSGVNCSLGGQLSGGQLCCRQVHVRSFVRNTHKACLVLVMDVCGAVTAVGDEVFQDLECAGARPIQLVIKPQQMTC